MKKLTPEEKEKLRYEKIKRELEEGIDPNAPRQRGKTIRHPDTPEGRAA